MDTVERITHALARGIGCRRAGSDADRRAAALLEAEFAALCPEVVRQEYRFLGWSPGEEGRLTLAGETLSTRVGIACPPTPESGITGVLEPLGHWVYGLREAGAGGFSAHIMAYGGPGGKAIPLLWRPVGGLPVGILGTEAGARLAAAARIREPVTFRCRPQLLPAAVSWNVEGILPGDPHRHIIITAHYDTVYGSPGANDNAASCACLPALAARLGASSRSQGPTFHFLATGAEEIDLQGARCYVRDLEWRGHLERIQLCVNFDSLTWGDGFRVGASPNAESFLSTFSAALAAAPRSAYTGAWEQVALDGGVDSAIFHAAKLPTLDINTWGDAATTALWHTPQDTVERVPWARAADAVEVFSAFLERLG